VVRWATILLRRLEANRVVGVSDGHGAGRRAAVPVLRSAHSTRAGVMFGTPQPPWVRPPDDLASLPLGDSRTESARLAAALFPCCGR
jgi:hypothetical protein